MDLPRFATGTPIDKLLGGGLEIGAVTNVYGPAGSGKTNIALAACLRAKRAIYIDTEGSFSAERFGQLGGDRKKLQEIVILEPHSWEEQMKAVKDLETLVKKSKPEIIVVDSLVALYRLVLNEESFRFVNRQLATQYSILSKVARRHNIPVLVTNQVYAKGDDVELSSRTVARYWSKCLIELKRGEKTSHRTAILRKHRSLPEGKRIEFVITAKDLREPRLGIF
jgi:DNA repair protein RadB